MTLKQPKQPHQDTQNTKQTNTANTSGEPEPTQNLNDDSPLAGEQHPEYGSSTDAQTSQPEAQPTDSSPSTEPDAEQLQQDLNELRDKYIRLYADFENFRKRTQKEKSEFLLQANAQLIKELLPVVDDFERALAVIQQTESQPKTKEGIELIYKKLWRLLEKYGLSAIDTAPGTEFNTDLHEAITQAPAPQEELKGKIIDTLEKGYYLHDKVLRFAKVVVGS